MRSNELVVERPGTFGGMGLTQEGPARKRPPFLFAPSTGFRQRPLPRAALVARAERTMSREQAGSSVAAVVSAVLAVSGALGALYLPILLH